MPFNGAGLYTPPATDFPAVANTLIESAKFNNIVNDLASGLTNTICKDGQTTPTANLPMGGFAHTNVANASARNQYAALGQVQDGGAVWGGTAGGTANAITFNLTPTLIAYATGQSFRFIAAATNTGPVTVAINGLAAKAIQEAGAALAGAEILLGGIYEITYDGTQFQLVSISIPAWSTGDVKATYKTAADAGWVLLNDGTIGDATSGGTTRANADCEALFTLLWNNTANADCAVSTGRGANAAADFAAHKTIALPKAKGRALGVSGTGAGLTARNLASVVGAEDAVVVSHSHGVGTLSTDAQGSHAHNVHLNTSPGVSTGATAAVTESGGHISGGDFISGSPPGVTANGAANVGATDASGSHAHNVTGSTAASGVSATGANMPPMQFLNVMVKL